jgi:hypothetical protein
MSLPEWGSLIQKQDLFTEMKHSSLAHKILDEFITSTSVVLTTRHSVN